ncbi:peptidase M56 [Clostridium sp. 'White wine YQ']|uniref:peptidase M56 n=1 Tax=Clostridium sp. 'White wine YQ' TaxID=3027474 RepID=UPI002365733E|nr:peptidase M56 [Clostridium sp. 'White wine YQ']MDD7795877.1 peptidase M56 [Clostridium sp. 'White wine YQ']
MKSKAKIYLPFGILLIFVFLLCISNKVMAKENTKYYESKKFNISLRYNKDWSKSAGYSDKFEGKDGFFQISASTGKDLSIDEVAKNEATHILEPFGSNPKIIKITIDGEEARLIMPSSDQSKDFSNQAELIVKYPKAITIDNEAYYYFILWADKNHIESISKTLKFIS